jgi:PAS domain S-box-containing protein
MLKQPNTTTDAVVLRRRAQARLKTQPAAASAPRTEADTRRLFHELQVHQIELEMQNAELARAQTEAQAMAEKLSDLYDFAPVGYFTFAEQGLILGVNLTGAACLGVERGRLLNRRFQLWVSPGSRLTFEAFLKRTFRSRTTQTCEVELLRNANTPIPVQIEGCRPLHAEGEAQCRAVVLDLTERKQAQQALQEAHRTSVAILESITDAFISLDRGFRLTYVNREAERLLGKTRRQMMGRNLWELFPEAAVSRLQREFEQAITAHRTARFEEFYPPFDRWCQVQAYPSAIGLSVYFTDITQRKRAEDKVRQLNTELEERVAARTAEVHELLDQSRHMQQQLRRLSHQVFQAQEEERKRISRELHDQIAQTLICINFDLLGLTRKPPASSRDLRQRVARTHRLVEASVNTLHRFTRELRPPALDDLGLIPALHSYLRDYKRRTGLGIRFTTSAGAERLDTTKCTVLYRVAQAALANIVQHAKASRVEVSIQKRPGKVRLEIKDDGIGFSMGPGFQDLPPKHLGLLGMRERLEMAGGAFSVESAPGRGTTIRAEIPLGFRRGRALAKGKRSPA